MNKILPSMNLKSARIKTNQQVIVPTVPIKTCIPRSNEPMKSDSSDLFLTSTKELYVPSRPVLLGATYNEEPLWSRHPSISRSLRDMTQKLYVQAIVNYEAKSIYDLQERGSASSPFYERMVSINTVPMVLFHFQQEEEQGIMPPDKRKVLPTPKR
jgi:hypothetical protein